VKNIAENCFSKPNVVSKQMTILQRLKYVDAQSAGRETYYELAEPLLRICNEVKENKGGPIKLFVDFLGNLYHAEEIRRRFMHHHILSKVTKAETMSDIFQEQCYCLETLQHYFPQDYQKWNVLEFEEAAPDFQIKMYFDELEHANAFKEIIAFSEKLPSKDKYVLMKTAEAYGRLGDIDHQIETANKILHETPDDIDALIMLSEALMASGNFREAEKKIREILQRNDALPNVWYSLGRSLFFQGKYSEAIEALLKAIELDESNIQSIELLSLSYGIEEKVEQALTQYKQLTVLNPENSSYWSLLGSALQILRRIPEAKEALNKSIELDENNILAIESLGRVLVIEGDVEQSLANFKRLTELKPEYSNGWSLMGTVLSYLGRNTEAKEVLKKAIVLDQYNDLAIEVLGRVSGIEGDAEQSLANFKRLTELKPEYSNGWSLMGTVLSYLGRVAEAKEALIKAIELDENDITSIYLLGRVFWIEGDTEHSLAHFKKIIEIRPDYSNGWSMMGAVLTDLGRTSEAKEALIRAIELDNKNIDAIELMGTVFRSEGNNKQALIYLNQLTRIKPDSSSVWSSLGKVLAELGKAMEAKEALNKSISLDDKDPNTKLALAGILISEGLLEDAKNQISKVLQEKPRDSEVLNSVGELYRENALFDEAKKYYDQAVHLSKEYYWPWINLVTCYIGLQKVTEAVNQLKMALEIAKKNNLSDELVDGFVENHTTLFIFSILDDISVYFDNALILFDTFGYREQFIKSMPSTIFGLLRSHHKIQKEKCVLIEKYLNEKFKTDDSMTVPLKFLHVGIKHLKDHNKKALLQLTKEERTTYTKFVLDYLKER